MYLKNKNNNFMCVTAIALLLAGCGGGGSGGEDNSADPSNTDTVNSNPTEVDSNPPEADNNPPEADNNPPEADNNPPEADNNPPEVDNNPPEVASNPPELTGSMTSLAGEGSYDSILVQELALSGSTQSPDKIIFTIVIPPSSGKIEMSSRPGGRISQFTQADIDVGHVVYKHERGASLSDSFEFDVDDGQGGRLVGEKYSIDIIPNITGLELERNDERVDLSWTVPASPVFSGVEVWRRDDGRYPNAPSDGMLVEKIELGEQVTDSVSVDASYNSQSFYYTVFSYGADGVYSDGVKVGLYCDTGRCVTVPDLRERNSISSLEDARHLRRLLINEIWGVDTLPGWMPESVFTVSDPRYSNAQSIQEIVVQMDDGIFSRIWFFTPKVVANGKLVIYHQGHRSAFHMGLDTIQRLLDEGFYVLGVSMPLIGGMNHIQDMSTLPVISYLKHEYLATLERPMRFFLEPVSVALNYVTSGQVFSSIYMMGLSGGGWTTVVYSAIDERIGASYPVAGSYPIYISKSLGGPLAGGDFEQSNPDFYKHVSHTELYLLGAIGRRQLQIYNEFDSCCFKGTYSNTFKFYIQSVLDDVDGSFDVVIDTTVADHVISNTALDIIVNDMSQ